MDSLVEFVGTYYRKNESYDSSNFVDYLWEKFWVDAVEEIPNVENCDRNLVRFKEDIFCMEMTSVIPLCQSAIQSGIQWAIEQEGFDVFKEFREELINLGLERFKELEQKCLPKKKFDFTLITEKPTLVRVLTCWSFQHVDDDCYWDLEGIVKHNQICSLIKGKKNERKRF